MDRLVYGPAAFGALLVLITIGVYLPAVDAQMVADDFVLVSGISFREAAAYWCDTFGFGRNEYRPLTALSFALDRALWNGDPRGYHATNIALHATVVVLVFLWLRRLSGEPWLAFLAALFFVVHPVHHSRVNWIAARDGTLSGVFRLLCLWAYTRHRQGAAPARSYSRFSVAMFAGSLLSYEGAAALPLVLGATELFSNPGVVLTRERIWETLRRLRPFLLVFAAYLIFWNVLFGGSLGAYHLDPNPESALRNYGRLLDTLAHGHQRWAGLLYLVAVVLGFRALRERWNLAWLSLLIVLLSYLPFCLLGGFAARFAYASALGYCLLLALVLLGAARGSSRWRPLAAGGVALGLFAYYTVEARTRVFEWREAGEIAVSIPRQLKEMHPALPHGAVLMFGGIPRMHRRAQVFPLGLVGVVEREYAGVSLQVESHERPLLEWAPRPAGPSPAPRYYFDYDPLRRRLVQLEAPGWVAN